jgi:hypothetical protein
MNDGLVALAVLALFVGAVAGALWYLRKRVAIIGEFLSFLIERKLWWMTPIIIVFLMLIALVWLSQGAAVAPFIYALF